MTANLLYAVLHMLDSKRMLPGRGFFDLQTPPIHEGGTNCYAMLGNFASNH